MQFKVYNYQEFTVCLGTVSPDTTQTFPNNAERATNSFFYFPFASTGGTRLEYANGDVIITTPDTIVDVQDKRGVSFTASGQSFGGWAALNFVGNPTFSFVIQEVAKDETLTIETGAGERKVLWVVKGICESASGTQYNLSRPGNISENKSVTVTVTENSKVCILTQI